MTVSVNLVETSNLLIMFSGETLPGYNETLYIHASVGGAVADPIFVELTPKVENLVTEEAMFVTWGAQSFNFHQNSVAPGTYEVKIQWCGSNDGGSIYGRTLTVIAVPS
jgi:hypothetical protein